MPEDVHGETEEVETQVRGPEIPCGSYCTQKKGGDAV